MNENLNLVEILKDCPKGTKLYSTVYGDVELVEVSQGECTEYPIWIKKSISNDYLTKDGRMYKDYNGECVLFPSREQRDWSKFKVKKAKFDPKTLQPFDKVLVRNFETTKWRCDHFSHFDCDNYNPCIASCCSYTFCIPYNDDTKQLVGTTDEAPEYYRYWEE